MLVLKGLNRESVVLDGNWVIKMRSGATVSRLPVSTFRDSQLTETTRRRSLFSRERESLITLVITLDQMIGLVLPADRLDEVNGFILAIQQAATVGGQQGSAPADPSGDS